MCDITDVGTFSWFRAWHHDASVIVVSIPQTISVHEPQEQQQFINNNNSRSLATQKPNQKPRQQ